MSWLAIDLDATIIVSAERRASQGLVRTNQEPYYICYRLGLRHGSRCNVSHVKATHVGSGSGVDTNDLRKARGAFFTPPEIAHYLARWAVRSPSDRVLEPSCGEASFLLAAADRLEDVGANPLFWNEQLHGVEIFEASARNAESLLRDAGFDARVAVADFFEHETPISYDGSGRKPTVCALPELLRRRLVLVA